MEQPTDVEGVQRFVGMVKYLAKFLPDLSDIREPLRRLTHKDVELSWSEEQSLTFRTIKQHLTAAPVLPNFDPKVVTEG